MDSTEPYSNQIDEAIEAMREVAAWGRNQGFRVWLDEWLTKEELLTIDVYPENFYVGKIGANTACAFILQWNDSISVFGKNRRKKQETYAASKICAFVNTVPGLAARQQSAVVAFIVQRNNTSGCYPYQYVLKSHSISGKIKCTTKHMAIKTSNTYVA